MCVWHVVCLGTIAKHLKVPALRHFPAAFLDYEVAEVGLALSALPQGYVSNHVISRHLSGGCTGIVRVFAPRLADGVIGFEPGELAGLSV